MPGSQIHSLLKYSFIPFSLHHLTVNLSQGRVSRGDGGGAGVAVSRLGMRRRQLRQRWVCEGSAMDFSRVWWLERRLDWVCDGSLSFLFFSFFLRFCLLLCYVWFLLLGFVFVFYMYHSFLIV